MADPKKIVILGGGFAGIQAALTLQKRVKRGEADIVLVNKHDYHYFTTWLHKPAAGTEHPERSSVAIADILDPGRVAVLKRTVRRIDTAAKKVLTDEGDVPYDILIAALGGEPETFGIRALRSTPSSSAAWSARAPSGSTSSAGSRSSRRTEAARNC